MLQLMLPWPPAVLSPNARAHWRVKAAAAKKYRAGCFMLPKEKRIDFAKFIIETAKPLPPSKIPVTLIFHPPDNRKRDDDNFLAAFKSGRDGMAEAWSIDDHRFAVTPRTGHVLKGGAVEVRI